MPTVNSYDDLPYTCLPQPTTHPARLASVVSLLGLSSPDVSGSRILELGCADGSNLLSIAVTLPESFCLGIDYSARQIEAGQQQIQTLQLENIELRHADILELGPEIGMFDYIIVHGVFSWVPEAIQQHILKLCAKQLTPEGVAYISYNTRPGWNMRSTIRDMLLYHTQQFDDMDTRIAQMRAWMDFLKSHMTEMSRDDLSDLGNDQVYYQYLKNESEYFSEMDADYLFHEFLEDCNQPLYFHEFMDKAHGVNLVYAGDASLINMFREFKSVRVLETLGELDTLHKEQYLDFLENRQFRQTLLRHQASSDETQQRGVAVMKPFYFSASLKPETESMPSLVEIGALKFEDRRILITEERPIGKAALLILYQQYPAMLSFADIFQQASQLLAEQAYQPTGNEREELATILARYASSSAIESSITPPVYTLEPGDNPLASPLARLQLQQGKMALFNLKNETIRLNNPILAHIMLELDGDHNREQLVEQLQQWIAEGRITPPPNVDKTTLTREALHQVLDSALKALAKNALLLA
ncbi:methyltransferase regulatory domain-containing protein [Candidatus Venteria ishoeyi]|uniref:tRNA (Guanine-N(7)-)-methyltransferase n=1 Tax=Candidatus Venteria ishoeyi TaxID=1899563 RepID=A0A1H6FEL9_9GAMM|nr:class I SAM-dependent methyltransferase [Candidatus Venteria ishoeyi]SEH07789.1 Uncharacterised protein [Candidatus Venteria ishoeyi]